MSGKRERNHAQTGMTPLAKMASPGHQDTDDRNKGKANLEAVELMRNLRMDVEELPSQWSADEDDEPLLKEAIDEGTSQLAERAAESKQSGAKRSFTAQIQTEGSNGTPRG